MKVVFAGWRSRFTLRVLMQLPYMSTAAALVFGSASGALFGLVAATAAGATPLESSMVLLIGVSMGAAVALGVTVGAAVLFSKSTLARRTAVVGLFVICLLELPGVVAVASVVPVTREFVARDVVHLIDEKGEGPSCVARGYLSDEPCVKVPAQVTCPSCRLISLWNNDDWKERHQPDRIRRSDDGRQLLEDLARSRQQLGGLDNQGEVRPWNPQKKGPDPRRCVSCKETVALMEGSELLYFIEREGDGEHRVMGRMPWSEFYFDLGDHVALDSAMAMADAVLEWQNIDDGDWTRLLTGTFDLRKWEQKHTDWTLPGPQFGRGIVEGFIRHGRDHLKSWLFSEEYGTLTARLHYHAVIVGEFGGFNGKSRITDKLIRSWWRGGSYWTVRPTLVRYREAVVVYVLKYVFKDVVMNDGWIEAGVRDGQMAWPTGWPAAESWGYRWDKESLARVKPHDQRKRFDVGLPGAHEERSGRRRVWTPDQLYIARQMAREGLKPDVKKGQVANVLELRSAYGRLKDELFLPGQPWDMSSESGY